MSISQKSSHSQDVPAQTPPLRQAASGHASSGEFQPHIGFEQVLHSMAAMESLPDQPWSEAETAMYQAMLADTVTTLAAVRAFTGAARIPEPDQVPRVAAAEEEPEVDWASTVQGMIAVADALASLTPRRLAAAPAAPAGGGQGAAPARPEEPALQAIQQVTQQAESGLPGMPLAFDAHSVPSPGGTAGSPMPPLPASHEPYKPASGLSHSQQQVSSGEGAQPAPLPLTHSSLRVGAQPAPSSHASAPAAKAASSSASAASGGWSLGKIGHALLAFGGKAEAHSEQKVTVAKLLREKHGHSTKTPGATPAPRALPAMEPSGLPPVPESSTATSAAASAPAAPQASPGPSTPSSARALQLAVSAEDHFTSSSAGSPVRGGAGSAAGCARCAAALQQLHDYHQQQVRSARQLSSALMRYSRWLRHHAALRGRDVLAAALVHTDTPGGGGDSSRDGTRRRNYSMNTLSRPRRSESGAAASAKSSPTQRGSFGTASDGRPGLQAPSGKQAAAPHMPWWLQPTQSVADIKHNPMYSLLAEVPAHLRDMQVCAVDVPPGAPAWMLPELGATQIQAVVQQLRTVTEQRDLAQAKVRQLEEQVRTLTERLDTAARQASGPGVARSMAMTSLPPGARNGGLTISSPMPRAAQLSTSQRSRQSTASSSLAAPERNAFGNKHLLPASSTSGGFSLHSSRRTRLARARADSAGSAESCAGESVASGGAQELAAARPDIDVSPSRAISGLSGIATDDSGHAV